MDERIARLKTPEECEQFAINVESRLPDLSQQARRKAVELQAAAHGANRDVEREALEAVYAYERVLAKRNGRRIPASRTWQMIKKYGIIEAIERIVKRPDEATGYTALAEMGMLDFAFEAVVIRHPDAFTPEALAKSKERLDNHSIQN